MCLKINWSIKTLCHKPSMVVTRSGLWALKATESPHHLQSVGSLCEDREDCQNGIFMEVGKSIEKYDFI